MDVRIEKIPQNIEEFISFRDQVAKQPEGGAAVFVLALLLYGRQQALGKASMAIAVEKSKLIKGEDYNGYALNAMETSTLHQQVTQHPYLGQSYIQGTVPDKAYDLPVAPHLISINANPNSGNPQDGVYKVFVSCTGADSARPITVAKNDKGIWKAREWSSLLVGIRKPPISDEDEL